MINSLGLDFPVQRVGKSEKSKAEWYANCIDYIIELGISCNDRLDTETRINILHGNIPDEFYKKTLNPYNSSKEKYKRFPATMRNFDIMSDIIRRYVSEYYKGVHEFAVGASNPDIVINKNYKLKEQVMQLAQQAFMAEFEKRYQQMVQEAQANGTPAEQINPQEAMPDPKEFIKNFNENYIDDQSVQGQQVLEYIQANTEDMLIYLSAFFNYVSFGECYTYADVRGRELIKECIPLMEAYPIPNSNMFVEDHDMFARKQSMTYQQIIDMFDEYLDDNDRKFLESYYGRQFTNSSRPKLLTYDGYFETYPDVCGKFSDTERRLFRAQPISIADVNNNLYEVWHVVWKGEAKQGILTYVNEMGMISTTVVDEGFQFDPNQGHINIEWEFVPQVYEGYRIGTRQSGIYPIKARAIAYNRKGKLPYNGIMEVLPYFGKFSIVGIITPYQILRNIMYYHREMVVAKNKMLILLLPESLIADNAEDKIYKMAADGTLIYDDSEDNGSVKAQQIRLLNANLGNYITELTNLIEAIKAEAREAVDMNQQRYGQINQSAGKGITDEAVARSSMGSVIIFSMFDEFRRHDYNRDIDYCKLAYVDGLDDMFFDKEGNRRYISLDVNTFINSDYSTTVRNNEKEREKINQLKQWAFSAAQNGDLQMALEAICNDNVSSIKRAVTAFNQIKQQHEEAMKQADQMLEQQKLQNEIAKIQAKGEEDRKTEAVKANYTLQQKYIDIDASQLTNPFAKDQMNASIQQQANANKQVVDMAKLDIERQKTQMDFYNKAADRQVKLKELDTQYKIAKTNKNKYDK